MKHSDLTYKNAKHWNDPAPSMDEKDKPSPPIRTTEEYERDRELGIVTPIGLKYKPPIYGNKKQ